MAAIKEARALAPWAGPPPLAPERPSALQPWPQPMALDKHWVVLDES